MICCGRLFQNPDPYSGDWRSSVAVGKPVYTGTAHHASHCPMSLFAASTTFIMNGSRLGVSRFAASTGVYGRFKAEPAPQMLATPPNIEI